MKKSYFLAAIIEKHDSLRKTVTTPPVCVEVNIWEGIEAFAKKWLRDGDFSDLADDLGEVTAIFWQDGPASCPGTTTAKIAPRTRRICPGPSHDNCDGLHYRWIGLGQIRPWLQTCRHCGPGPEGKVYGTNATYSA